MINKFKILTLVGTRPELIKLSLVIKELDSICNNILIHSGQNFDYELNQVFFDNLTIRKPDYFLEAAGLTPAHTIANVISKLDDILEIEKPDAFLIYGDTNSCLGLIAAKKRKIPIFHMEAGNRCFDQRVPEEVNRKIVDHLSDINMVHSEHARRYLLAEGIKPETIFKVGSPMGEILSQFADEINQSKILSTMDLKSQEYFVVSSHREENVDNPERLQSLITSLERLKNEFKKKIIFSTHPRTRKKLEDTITDWNKGEIEFMKPLGFFDYNKLQKEAFCVLSDSGTLTEESSLLEFPAIMIRQAHERPEGMDVAAVVMADIKAESLIAAVRLVTKSTYQPDAIQDYANKSFSKKVVRIIFSHIDYINRTVWMKPEVQ
jgi:UDP-N-acetylglucosamine 2-epimerase